MEDNRKNTKQAAQRAELHKRIWSIADDLRGAVDGWDFKQYVLSMLFYRFISENMVEQFNKNEHEAGKPEFDYAKLDDAKIEAITITEMVERKGFFIKPSELFCNVLEKARSANKKETLGGNGKGEEKKDEELFSLNTALNRVFRNIEASVNDDSIKKSIENTLNSNKKAKLQKEQSQREEAMNGLFEDVDVTHKRLGTTVEQKNKTLLAVMEGIASIDFGDFKANDIDAFGDAYEYLISNYASNAGKSGGEYFTPQSVAKLLTRLVMLGKEKVNKVYDPTCGSGALLLQMQKQFGAGAVEEGFFGQDTSLTFYNLARMNMILHNVNFSRFSIRHGDTLIDPKHKDAKPFDAIVSNPPYSIKWEGDKNPTLMNDDRFSPAGKLAPKNYADYAFIMHTLSHLSSSGRAVIVCFPGIFYRKGAEATIRQYLVEQGVVDCVIQLPANLFFGTSIATCILVMAKNRVDSTKVLFIDASQEFKKETNNNILEEGNIEAIVKAFKDRVDVPYFARQVSVDEIKANAYNLSVSTYVEKEDTREKVDIGVLNAEIRATVKRIDELRAQIDHIVEELENA